MGRGDAYGSMTVEGTVRMYRQEALCSELKLSQLTKPCPSCMLRVEDLGPMSCEKWI